MQEETKASESRKTLLEAWDKCELGVKERVKEKHSRRAVHYILKTEGYSNNEKILEILETIKKESKKVKDRAIAMDQAIKETLS